MTVSEFYTYTFVVFDEIAYEWVQGSYVAFEIKIFDEDQEVIVFTVEFLSLIHIFAAISCLATGSSLKNLSGMVNLFHALGTYDISRSSLYPESVVNPN